MRLGFGLSLIGAGGGSANRTPRLRGLRSGTAIGSMQVSVVSGIVPVGLVSGTRTGAAVIRSVAGLTATGVSSGTTIGTTGPNFAVATPPSFTGTGLVGDPLTYVAATWLLTPDSVTHTWNADGAPIPGETGATYTPDAADDGVEITVTETAVLSGYANGVSTSAAVAITYAAPTLSGTDIDDVTYAAEVGTETIDATVAFAAGAGTFSLVDAPGIITINETTGVITVDKDALASLTVAVVVRKTNSGGSVDAAAFDVTLDALDPEVSGLSVVAGEIVVTFNRPGTATAVLNSTETETGASVISEYEAWITTPDAGTEAATQFEAETGENTAALDLTGVTAGNYWLHVALDDGFDRPAVQTIEIEVTAVASGASFSNAFSPAFAAQAGSPFNSAFSSAFA